METIKKKGIDKEKVLRVVDSALGMQFDSGYSFFDMIQDCDLTGAEMRWAAKNISYKAYDVTEVA